MNNIIASIVITRYDENLTLVKRCVNSLINQTCNDYEIIFLDQIKDKFTNNYIEGIKKSKKFNIIYKVIRKNSLSYARNYGIFLAKSKIVLFCDIDCKLANNWIEEILITFIKFRASIVGTKIIPEWEIKPNNIHNSKYISDFYSLLDLGQQYKRVNRVIGASFAINKNIIKDKVIFNEKLGRTNGNLLGGEETELCERVVINKGFVYFSPKTYAKHYISKNRMSFRWLIKRIYYAGISRKNRGGKVSPINKKKSLWDLFVLIMIAPIYLLGYFSYEKQNNK